MSDAVALLRHIGVAKGKDKGICYDLAYVNNSNPGNHLPDGVVGSPSPVPIERKETKLSTLVVSVGHWHILTADSAIPWSYPSSRLIGVTRQTTENPLSSGECPYRT